MTSLMCLCLSSGLFLGQDPSIVLPPPTLLTAPPQTAVYPVTLGDFAHGFIPLPGKYEVVFLHPVKKCPVKVCFTLPPGCPNLSVGKRSLVFDYGDETVTIRFKLLHGGVKVSYR